MKLAGDARHLEVQLLADQYGTNISLLEEIVPYKEDTKRLLKKHQSPLPERKLSTKWKMPLSDCKLVGYVSAGTVEYLYPTLKINSTFGIEPKIAS